MNFREYSHGRLAAGVIALIIGLLLKFPTVLKSMPPQYRVIGIITLTEAQYATVRIISYALIIAALAYINYLLVKRFRKK